MKTPLLIALVVGSLRKGSFNQKLADALLPLAPEEISFLPVRIDDLPLYNQDDDETPAPSVSRLRSDIRSSQGILFITPEYNRSIPGVLKNAIDHGSRPYGKSVWAGRPAGVLGASIGPQGTSMAQQHLRNILAYLDMPTLGQPETFLQANELLFAPDGSLSELRRPSLQIWMDRYANWVRQHAN